MRFSIRRHWIGGITLGAALVGMTMSGERVFAQGAPHLGEITRADLTKIPSGCSFVVYDKSRQIVAISTTPLGPHVSFWFKIDGKLIEAGGRCPQDQGARLHPALERQGRRHRDYNHPRAA